ncbi:cysteine desulfurase [Tenacibaculum sp. AHE15PA]|uniref:cysteine desulfurase family protein n=1 Tax=unclassified Tenacibaculum TaxID=2635139 RepID=UPI001C4FA85C|nr:MULTISPECIES: cysteine desulfurase family protein [unclassified Tenacibaculum]QXP74204.1 cysteine desulfurase [Tenacibaculum sp. AHE14PA]QXP75426.1 cysteine desulfurase [Tenacibaculum sp. AHE15PA]
MESVYLDNAATTPMLPEVIEVMQQAMLQNFGNPSSTHQFGRKAKAAVETARKNIAKHFNVAAREIVFTAGGTEADNLILQNAVVNLGVTRIITSKIEHHAVLRTVAYLQKQYGVKVDFVELDENGAVVIDSLEKLLKQGDEKTLVSLMYINNEIGNILPIDEVVALCKTYQAYFHSDTVQAIGHYQIDLQKIPIDFIVASAHKFHGPKGVGFVYIKKGIAVQPMLYGGEQEKGVRSSTENVHAILGMEKALEVAYINLEKDKEYILNLKKYLIGELINKNTNISFNGLSADVNNSSYLITSLRLPIRKNMLLFDLDLKGIAVSGGSACQSGSNKGSHVLQVFLSDDDVEKTSLRVSLSKLNTKKEVDSLVNILLKITK